MKLRNKKTGEIGKNEGEDIEDKRFCIRSGKTGEVYVYDSLEKLNEEWEDYKEREWNWYVDWNGEIKQCDSRVDALLKFETKEEAEKAIEKLEAWKRLRDKGFKFEGIKEDYTRILQGQDPFRTGKRYLQFNKSEDEEWMKENWEDLDLIFGDEE